MNGRFIELEVLIQPRGRAAVGHVRLRIITSRRKPGAMWSITVSL